MREACEGGGVAVGSKDWEVDLGKTSLGEEGLGEREGGGAARGGLGVCHGVLGCQYPRSAADSVHVVGPLIACRASLAWAGARSLQVGATRGCKARVT